MYLVFGFSYKSRVKTHVVVGKTKDLRYTSNCETKVQIKEIKENHGHMGVHIGFTGFYRVSVSSGNRPVDCVRGGPAVGSESNCALFSSHIAPL